MLKLNTPIVVEYMVWIGKYIKDAPDNLRIRVWWNQYKLMRGHLDWEQQIKHLSYHLQNLWMIYDILVKGTIIEMQDAKCSPKMMIDFIKKFQKN